MTVRFADEDGNEAVIKESHNLAKYRIDEGFRNRERVLGGIRALAQLYGLPLLDMDEMRREFRNFVVDEGDLPEDGEHPITVTDQRTGDPMEIVIDVTGVHLEDRDPDDIDVDFFSEEITEEEIRSD